MRPETEKLINDRKHGNKNTVEILKGEFETQYGKIILKQILALSVNNVDIYDPEDENIATGEFRIYVSPSSFYIDDKSHCEWDRETLLVNNSKYSVSCEDLVYFCSDFNADVKNTLNSIMEAFCNYVNRRN